METVTPKTSTDKAKTQSENATQEEPKRLSKAGQWLRDNPGGMFEYVDRRTLHRMKH